MENPKFEVTRKTPFRTNKNKVIVVGDSITKFIRPNELPNQRKLIKCCETPWMLNRRYDRIQPTAKKKPDATLLHVRTNDYTKGSNIQLGGVSRFWVQKIRQEKLLKFTKIFALYQVFMYNFLCQTVLIFLIYILVTKIIKTFWSRYVTDI